MVKLNNLIRINFKVITFYLISGYIFLSVLRSTQNFSGDYDIEVIPVPIPNTEENSRPSDFHRTGICLSFKSHPKHHSCTETFHDPSPD